MKRLSMIMMCLLAMLVASLSAKAQEVTITLYPGCNWISYPNSEMLDINTALGDFVPVDGDIIQSQVNYSVYIDGQWRGSVTHFMPGWGYKYYSNRTETVSFTFSHAGTLPTVTTADPTGITLSGFTGGGEVVNMGNSVITVFGLCWGTNPNPTVNDFQAVAGYGMGSFTWEVEYLEMNTTYYVRAYALTENGMVYGEEKTFSTLTGIPVVTTMDVTEISYHQATCGGEVSDDGGLAVTDRGICWSTSPNPTVDGDHIASGSGLGSFSLNMTGLASFTTYYVRAYATNSHTTSYGEEMSFTTLAIPTYTITVMANPAEGGTVLGGDVIELGQSCTVTATPNTGYDFVNWTENGEVVSTEATYSFIVNENRNLVAHFAQNFEVNVTVSPTTVVFDENYHYGTPIAGGTVSGGGVYLPGEYCTVTTTANANYVFVNWTENGVVVSTNPTYSFVANADRNLVANYRVGGYQQFVDLGLPSGTLWATCNLGADNPEDSGVYFDWGGTLPHEHYTYGYEPFFDENHFITKYCNDPDYGSQGYVDNLTVLLPEDDAATANWGADWRMPTKEEWDELLAHTTHYQTTRNGVSGLLFTSIDGHTSLFLPAAGCLMPYFSGVGSYWRYWSSSLDTTDPRYACLFDGVYGANGGASRCIGTPIRAVRTSD